MLSIVYSHIRPFDMILHVGSFYLFIYSFLVIMGIFFIPQSVANFSASHLSFVITFRCFFSRVLYVYLFVCAYIRVQYTCNFISFCANLKVFRKRARLERVILASYSILRLMMIVGCRRLLLLLKESFFLKATNNND